MNSNPANPPMDDQETAPRIDETPKADKVNWLRELRGLALMLLAVIAFHTFFAKPFYIPSASMEPNLLVGDRLVVSKYPYGWSWVSASFPLRVLPRSDWRIAPATPEYGDIVIAVPPDKTEDYIKRVIALPGDRIAVVDGKIILNGEQVPQEFEPPVRIREDSQICDGRPCLADFAPFRVVLPGGKVVYEPPTYRETLPNGATYRIIDDNKFNSLDNYREITVPEGHVFLMGDNRDHSADSRADAGYANGLGGPVPIANIGGRAEFITFSLDGTTTWNPLTWWKSLREGRAWTTLRPAIREKARPDE